jgi:hypothetical protein
MSTYILGTFFLIENVAVYQSGIADKYGHENEIPLLLVRIQECVRESNDAGSQKYHVMMIHGRSIWRIRIDFHSYSWKAKLQNKEIASRFVRVIFFIDSDYKHEWPRFSATFRSRQSNEHYKCSESHNLTVIFVVPSLAMLEGSDSK